MRAVLHNIVAEAAGMTEEMPAPAPEGELTVDAAKVAAPTTVAPDVKIVAASTATQAPHSTVSAAPALAFDVDLELLSPSELVASINKQFLKLNDMLIRSIGTFDTAARNPSKKRRRLNDGGHDPDHAANPHNSPHPASLGGVEAGVEDDGPGCSTKQFEHGMLQLMNIQQKQLFLMQLQQDQLCKSMNIQHRQFTAHMEQLIKLNTKLVTVVGSTHTTTSQQLDGIRAMVPTSSRGDKAVVSTSSVGNKKVSSSVSASVNNNVTVEKRKRNILSSTSKLSKEGTTIVPIHSRHQEKTHIKEKSNFNTFSEFPIHNLVQQALHAAPAMPSRTSSMTHHAEEVAGVYDDYEEEGRMGCASNSHENIKGTSFEEAMSILKAKKAHDASPMIIEVDTMDNEPTIDPMQITKIDAHERVRRKLHHAKEHKDIMAIFPYCNLKYLHTNLEVLIMALDALIDVTNHKNNQRDLNEDIVMEPMLTLIRAIIQQQQQEQQQEEVEPMIKLKNEVKEKAVAVLWNICNDNNRKHQLVQSGDDILPEIFSMMKNSKNEYGQKCSNGLICSLVAAEQNYGHQVSTIDRLREAGVVDALVHVLKYSTSDTLSTIIAKGEAAGAIWNLAYERVHQVEIYNTGVVPKLIELLRGELSDMETKRCAAGALCNITDAPENAERSVREGIIPPIIEALKTGSSSVREQAARVVENIAAVNDDLRIELLTEGICEPLLHIIKALDRDNGRDGDYLKERSDMKKAAVSAIKNLVENETVATKFRDFRAETILRKYQKGLSEESAESAEVEEALNNIILAG